jgi:hypothetical protein
LNQKKTNFPVAIHTQVVIDNADYICYAEARFLDHQNDAKQFTMMQQIGVIGNTYIENKSKIMMST